VRKFKVGIVGSGVISRTYLADIQAFYRDLDVVACADIDLALAQKLASEFHVAKAYTTEDLLNDPEIDIVINLTPPQFHVAVDRQIIRAGKHLFSEKPFAPTLQQAAEVLALAEEAGIRVGCAPDTFLASGLQSMRYYLDAGIIGKPFFVTANMTTFGVETWHPNPVTYYQKGSGPIMEMAPYYLAAIVSLLGPVESLAAFSAQPSDTRRVYGGPKTGTDIPVETPTHYTAILRLTSGVVVNLNVSFDIYKSSLPMFEIYGDGGTLMYPDPNFGGGTPRVYRKEQYTDVAYQNNEASQARRERFYELPELFPRVKDYSRGIGVLDLAKAIDTGEDNRTNGAWILHITEAMEGLLRSGETGELYRMTTTCERPRPIEAGGFPEQV
jgi:predicted dehydrogenase